MSRSYPVQVQKLIYVSLRRCYHLARLHCIHPTPSFASAIQLLSRASLFSRQVTASLFDTDTPVQEEIIPLPRSDVDGLTSRIESLHFAARRALFAERMPKPVFFDTAFNYIDMPLDELLVLAGKKSAEPTVTEKMAEVMMPAVKSVVGKDWTREATPSGEESGEAGGKGEKPKGWLGGWFGRG